VNSLRRGACPGIFDPMPTGDGLLTRLMPSGPLAVDTVVALCDVAQAHGNGVVEVTQRGSLQFRGLSEASAPEFARCIVALGLDARSGCPILASPLMGLDAHEFADLRPLLAVLRAELANNPAASTGPKVSVLLDGGGGLHLDDVPGDIRVQAVQANENSRLHVSIAGNAATATTLGWTEPQHALKVIVQVLSQFASRGTDARARDFANRVDAQALRASLADLRSDAPPPNPRRPAEPIGVHRLHTGQVALGIALAFGFTEAAVLKRWARVAAACGASSIQASPGRSLLAIGLEADAANELSAAAAAAGFLVRPNDPRRHVVACAGAPACKSARLSTRELAPVIAEAAKPLLDGSLTIHLSGCTKGCAHPNAAALTFVGPDSLVVQGRAGDTPHGTTPIAHFIAGLPALGARRRPSPAVQESSASMVSRLGAAGVLDVMGAAHD
jgi:precorrin-3B synthase